MAWLGLYFMLYFLAWMIFPVQPWLLHLLKKKTCFGDMKVIFFTSHPLTLLSDMVSMCQGQSVQLVHDILSWLMGLGMVATSCCNCAQAKELYQNRSHNNIYIQLCIHFFFAKKILHYNVIHTQVIVMYTIIGVNNVITIISLFHINVILL